MTNQPYLDKAFEPPHNVDIERAIALWDAAKREQKLAAAATRTAHSTVVLHIQNAGLEAYPWTNPDTGKKRNILVTREPRLKEAMPPRPNRRGGDAEVVDPAERKARRKKREEEKVEVRRVPRESVEKELDPFAATRAAMEKGKAEKAGEKPEAKHSKPKASRKR